VFDGNRKGFGRGGNGMVVDWVQVFFWNWEALDVILGVEAMLNYELIKIVLVY
jgi:hypothetical protein